MENNLCGEKLLADHQDLEIRLMHSGSEGLISLIDACIAQGWSTKEAILAKVDQIGGPYYRTEIGELLDIHSSPLARPQRWTRDETDRFANIEPKWDPRELEFWKPARSAA